MKVNHNHISNTSVNNSEDVLEAQDEISNDNNKNQESIWNKKSIFHTWLLLLFYWTSGFNESNLYSSFNSINCKNVGKTKMNQPCGTQEMIVMLSLDL